MAKIENNVPLEGSGNYIDRTSELINDGESGTSRFIEEIELEEAIANIELTPGPQGEQGIPGPVGPVGPKGDIGSTGPPGLKGDKGDRGDIGPQGVPGQKGDTGNTGATGATGLKGDKGDQGPIGPQGDRGIQGPKGDKGDIGPTGLRGLQGDKGDQGPIGFTGQKGDKGDTGPQGIKGDQGIAGYTPIKGIDYFDGAKGDKGDKGNDGAGVTILGTLPNTGSLPSTGNPGDAYLIDGDLWVWNTNTNTWNNVGKIQGPKGDKGDTGTQGIQGVKGDKGDTGATGPKGDKGDKGDQGLIGLTGNTGAKGDTGSQGPKGDKGDQGVQGQQGNPGPSTTISIGNVTTGAPGSSASASMTGVSPNQTLNLVIPQGPAGNPAPVQTLSVGNLMGELSISQGNTVHVNSLQIINKQDANTIPHGNSGGLETWAFNANNATNYPVITGSGGGGGISYFRNGTSGLHSSFDILKMEHSEDKLKFRVGTGTSTKTPWRNFASEDWVINEFSGNFAKIDGSNINPTTWSNLTAGNSLGWSNQGYSSNINTNIGLFMTYDYKDGLWKPAGIQESKNALGLNSQVLNPTLQSVTDNGNTTTNDITIDGKTKLTNDLFFKTKTNPSGVYFGPGANGNLYISGHADYSYTKTFGVIDYVNYSIYWEGQILTGSHGNSAQWNKAFDWGDYREINGHNSQQYLGSNYVSGGLEKPNYFGGGKLKLQMLHGNNIGQGANTWNDVLWLSSYHGEDVKLSTAIISSKYSNKISFAKQNFDDANWGTLYDFWHSGNFNPNTKVNVSDVAYLNDTTNIVTNNPSSITQGNYLLNHGNNHLFGDYNTITGHDNFLDGFMTSVLGFNNKIANSAYANTIGSFNTIDNASRTSLFGFNLYSEQEGFYAIGQNNLIHISVPYGSPSITFAIGNGSSSSNREDLVQGFSDNSFGFRGRAFYDYQTRNPNWFNQGNTLVDVDYVQSVMGTGGILTNNNLSYTPCTENVFGVAMRSNTMTMSDEDNFTACSQFNFFSLSGVVEGFLSDGTIGNKVITRGVIHIPQNAVNPLLWAGVDSKPYLCVRYDGLNVVTQWMDSSQIHNYRKEIGYIIHKIGELVKKGTEYYLELNQEII